MTSWSRILESAIAFRHELHQHPELSWQEEMTAGRIRQRLDQLQIRWRPCATHGTVATLASDASGPHIGLRGDIDALPIREKADVAYRSTHDGCMHACGHDGHTAALWATAAWLKAHEDELPGPVTLLFQPAEEGGHGAREMIAEGALEGIDCIYGWHNWPAIPFGQAVCPDGPVMSGNGSFKITLHGRGGHASQPDLCRDPVLAAAAITLNLQQIISRRLPPQTAAVVSVTSIDALNPENVIPETVTLGGGIRLERPELRQIINDAIDEIATQTALSYGVEAEVVLTPRYEATVNHADAAARYREALAAEFGESWHAGQQPVPIMASEDFSYYLNQIPGAFALIGMSAGSSFQHSCHSPSYQFNDALLEPMVRVFARLVGAPLPDSKR
ncbi:N(2)-acetyl-L-2,4-diaminobutanoate deacetylase DoeB2 [Motiliproteus sediminis]|uniref:N(2)-acetyl-L-2,4-diaminobutanoate deacetylase DoeB2 n=1 Tax=Motiliproteus sediminis TaxID=1468178 RepID=UPI001AEF7A2E|nr:N(2)-acetyl-L-2,4-diaminobutanoate deacetylase DoeB2 [Motiliproteus sediminis]